MAIKMRLADKNQLVEILTTMAATYYDGPQRFFFDLVQQTTLPQNMRYELANLGRGVPRGDSRFLVEWALAHDTNPDDPDFTSAGSVLKPLLENDTLGLEARRSIAVIVVAYRLFMDGNQLRDLMTTYKIPQPAMPVDKAAAPAGTKSLSLPLTGAAGPAAVGPEIKWRETDPQKDPDLRLQSWPWSTPDYLDVGFLMRATECAAAVCRVEVPSKRRTGTGFLITPDLLLTNYHVLSYEPGEDINATAPDVTLRFGFITTASGGSAAGQAFKLTESPILSSSPVAKLDYVLLQVESAVKKAAGVKPIRSIAKSPEADKALNIIQHPEGDTLKIALSSDGISGIYKDSGLIQYLSRAAGGSSGSPCFNDQWELIALHHAERAKAFGSIREGILFSSIYDEISKIKEIADALPT